MPAEYASRCWHLPQGSRLCGLRDVSVCHHSLAGLLHVIACEIRSLSWACSCSVGRLSAGLSYSFEPCPSVPTTIGNAIFVSPRLGRLYLNTSHPVQQCHSTKAVVNLDGVPLSALSSLFIGLFDGVAAAVKQRLHVPYRHYDLLLTAYRIAIRNCNI